jgi:hypothetical protein
MNNKKISSRGPVISRRTFVERLGLGAGAALLGPIAQTLFAEAQGWAQVGRRKRAAFFVLGDSFLSPLAAPAEYSNLAEPVLDGPTKFTLPTSMTPLSAVRDRIMIVDGLSNEIPLSQHSTGFGALSCIGAQNGVSNEDKGGLPSAATIDQYLGSKISASTRMKTVLIATGKYNPTRNIFASGPGNPEAGFNDPKAMFAQVFSGLMAPTTGGVDKEAIKNQQLMSAMRADIARLQRSLAGSEKAKLDNYLAMIADFDARLKTQTPLDCKAGSPPTVGLSNDNKADPAPILDTLWDLATLALACGITNVVGASVGCGQAHKYCNWPMVGHSGDLSRARETMNGMFGRIVRMVNALKQVKEGDRTAFDNSAIVYMSDNGGSDVSQKDGSYLISHHTDKKRWPLVVIGNAGGALKADGRFVRFPSKRMNLPTSHSLADFYCTLGHALGAPTDTFGMGGPEKVKGPIAELLGTGA